MRAVGFLGLADCAAVEDETMAKRAALVWGNYGAQIVFDFDRVAVLGQAKAICEANAVGVYYVGRLAEGLAEDEVGGFAANTRQSGELFHCGGDVAAMARNKLF